MASKKQDGHKSGFAVRLPESYREALRKLTDQTRRTMVEECKLAIEAHLKAAGIDPPKK